MPPRPAPGGSARRRRPPAALCSGAAHARPGPRRPTGGSGPRSARTAASRSAARFEIGRAKRPRPLMATTEGTRPRGPAGRRRRSAPRGMCGRTSATRGAAPAGAEDEPRAQGDGEGRSPDREREARHPAGAVGRPDDPDVGASLLEDAEGHPQAGVARPGVHARAAGRGRPARCSPWRAPPASSAGWCAARAASRTPSGSRGRRMPWPARPGRARRPAPAAAAPRSRPGRRACRRPAAGPARRRRRRPGRRPGRPARGGAAGRARRSPAGPTRRSRRRCARCSG